MCYVVWCDSQNGHAKAGCSSVANGRTPQCRKLQSNLTTTMHKLAMRALIYPPDSEFLTLKSPTAIGEFGSWSWRM